MKKVTVVIGLVMLLIFFAGQGSAELRPVVKIMLARLGWVQSITVGLALSDFEKVKADASALAAQAKTVGGAATAPAKDFHLKLADAANHLAAAAGKKDAGMVVTSFGKVITACYSCHATLRDK